MLVTSVQRTTTTATIGVTVIEGPIPAIVTLAPLTISVQGTVTSSGAFNVNNAAVTAVSINAISGVGTISYTIATGTNTTTTDHGEAIVPQPVAFETFTATQAGQRFAVGGIDGVASGLSYVGMEVQYSAAPGTFEVDLQEADTDTDGAYQAVGTGVTAVGGTFFGRADYTVTANFVRAYIKTLTNGVSTAVKLTLQ